MVLGHYVERDGQIDSEVVEKVVQMWFKTLESGFFVIDAIPMKYRCNIDAMREPNRRMPPDCRDFLQAGEKSSL